MSSKYEMTEKLARQLLEGPQDKVFAVLSALAGERIDEDDLFSAVYHVRKLYRDAVNNDVRLRDEALAAHEIARILKDTHDRLSKRLFHGAA